MIFNINRKIDLVESFQNFNHCPKGTHTHNAVFKLKIDTSLLESSALIEKIQDTLSENIIYLQDRWTLHFLAETMLNELKASEIDVKQVNLKLEDMEIDAEFCN